MNKTYSQKVALVFSIVSSILLIPASFGLFLSMVILYAGIEGLRSRPDANLSIFIFPAVISAIYFFGGYLFVHYIKYYRGTVSSNKMKKIWIMTAVYNGIFSIAPIFTIIGFIVNFNNFNSLSGYKDLLIYSPLYIWWIIATIFSLRAFSLERQPKLL